MVIRNTTNSSEFENIILCPNRPIPATVYRYTEFRIILSGDVFGSVKWYGMPQLILSHDFAFSLK